jgi:hypothetical protein
MNLNAPIKPELQEFDEAYRTYLEAANAMAKDRNALKVHNSLQRLIRCRAVTKEQICLKLAVLMELFDPKDQNTPEQLLLASIQRDLQDISKPD